MWTFGINFIHNQVVSVILAIIFLIPLAMNDFGTIWTILSINSDFNAFDDTITDFTPLDHVGSEWQNRAKHV